MSESTEGFRATNRIFEEEVVGRGDFASLARVYTEKARLLSPGVPLITGIPGIAAFWQGAAAALGVTAIRLHTLELAVTGDTAQELGRAEIFTRSGGGSPAHAKYVVLWKREGGAWKWDVDCWNMDA
ncbi:YybH family protein [Paracraurococcus lichenis]|uniref:Nuclear transport factor 2 family protein n=1 Tax=Paracraurococcus lichenis TaxID=3064888 RepID=A0ABT9E4Q7_9PROT|nr:nuclear transport factor 2 family protein [Paracraurococcus sp. LOR1-02]MDO9711154.1 nuclear transport factor 2 family protein [Paracraurococcus sp. LOR1-02]